MRNSGPLCGRLSAKLPERPSPTTQLIPLELVTEFLKPSLLVRWLPITTQIPKSRRASSECCPHLSEQNKKSAVLPNFSDYVVEERAHQRRAKASASQRSKLRTIIWWCVLLKIVNYEFVRLHTEDTELSVGWGWLSSSSKSKTQNL